MKQALRRRQPYCDCIGRGGNVLARPGGVGDGTIEGICMRGKKDPPQGLVVLTRDGKGKTRNHLSTAGTSGKACWTVIFPQDGEERGGVV